MSKILYVASTAQHLNRFHLPYIAELKNRHEVFTMATNDDGIDFPIPFSKRILSFQNALNLIRIRTILNREKFDKIILNTSLAGFLVRLSLIGMKNRPYVLNVVHGYLFPENAKGFKNRFLLLCEKICRKQTDDILVMNEEDKRIAKSNRLYQNNLYFTEGIGIQPVRYEKKETDRINLTYVGELSKRKNQSFLISAFAKMKDEYPTLVLVLLGEGKERNKLEKLIRKHKLEDRVILCGNVDNVPKYLSETAIYVSACKSEGLPFNILEAMHAGLPIVASDVKGQHDLLKSNGILYPLSDESAFLYAVKSILASKNYGVNAVVYPNALKYNLENVLNKNLTVMEEGL